MVYVHRLTQELEHVDQRPWSHGALGDRAGSKKRQADADYLGTERSGAKQAQVIYSG
jgi:hypothetical protein